MLLENVYNFTGGSGGNIYTQNVSLPEYLHEAIYTVEIIERKANGCSDNRTLG